jgi:hypothetical protein
MLNVLELLSGLTTAAKAGVGLATAASVVAVGGATGVVPVLPEQAEQRPAAEQPAAEQPAETAAEEENGEAGAPEGTHGKTVTDAVEAGLTGQELAEVARSHGEAQRQAALERAAEKSDGRAGGAGEAGAAGEEAATSSRPESVPPASFPEEAAEGEERSSAGRDTAGSAPVQDAPEGTPGSGAPRR